MTTAQLTYRRSTIHYQYFGDGPELLVCLHGYGESSGSFALLENRLPANFRVIALDMPYHGGTNWNEAGPFTPDMLWEIISHFNTGNQKPVLMGYSMGGRLALSLLEKYPAHIKQLILLAPDGLHTNKWYWLSTQTRPGNRLFRYTVQHPGWLFAMIRLGRVTRLLHPSVAKIALYYMSAPASRQLLYQRWTSLRLFKPSLKKIQQNIRQYQVPVQLVFGRFDNIIPAANGHTLAAGMEPWITVTQLDGGHQLLKEKHIAFISSLLVAQY